MSTKWYFIFFWKMIKFWTKRPENTVSDSQIMETGSKAFPTSDPFYWPSSHNICLWIYCHDVVRFVAIAPKRKETTSFDDFCSVAVVIGKALYRRFLRHRIQRREDETDRQTVEGTDNERYKESALLCFSSSEFPIVCRTALSVNRVEIQKIF